MSLPRPYYEEAGITIYHGDCRDILPHLPKVDLVLTDPPYGAQTHAGAQTQTAGRSRRLLTFESTTAEQILEVIEMADPRRWAILTCDWKHVLPLSTSERLRFVRMGVWVKPDGCPQFTGDRPSYGWEAVAILHGKEEKLRWNNGGHSAVWTYHVFRGNEHPTMKPLGLLKSWVSEFSDESDLIVDPFMGSGTTLRAAKDLGRKAIGIEIEERYCEIAVKRLAQEVLPL